jgi:hypothetical protein
MSTQQTNQNFKLESLFSVKDRGTHRKPQLINPAIRTLTPNQWRW